ncbi:MAG: hypothetical protein V3G42_06365 [Oscillospiraceae bacterium]
MASFRQMENDFATLERGTARLNGIRDAIHQADSAQDLRWMFIFRYDYIEESIFCGDRYYAMIMFPEVLQLFDEHPELNENDRIAYDMLIVLRWIVEAVQEFPQVSREEIDKYFRLYKKRLLESGYGLNNYYMKRSLVYMHMDRDIAILSYDKFLEIPMDSMSDGKALCTDFMVEFNLYLGNEEKALTLAKPILEGKLKDKVNMPHSTQHTFCWHYLQTKEFEKAVPYMIPLEKRVDGDLYHMHHIGAILSLYSRLDVEKGIRLFNRNYHLYLGSKNPWLKFYFISGAVHLFDSMVKNGIGTDLVKVPESPISTAVAEGDTKKVAEILRKECVELAQRFDKRNGTTHFIDWLTMLDD